jgi:hypothetical protein
VAKFLHFSVRDTRAFQRHFLPALFLPRAPRLQAASSRELCDEHGIGGDGEYYGGNDAQLGRINVFYHEASSGKSVPRAVFFDLEPGVIDAARVSPLGELFRPGTTWAENPTTSTLPAAPLAVRRTYLIVVLRPVLKPLTAATRRCRIRRRTLGR